MFTTIDELLMYSFTYNKLPLLKLVQQGKVKKVLPLDPTKQKISIELYKDSFRNLDFEQFLDDMMTTKLDYVIRIVGKKINIIISFETGMYLNFPK